MEKSAEELSCIDLIIPHQIPIYNLILTIFYAIMRKMLNRMHKIKPSEVIFYEKNRRSHSRNFHPVRKGR
ncbi:MAG: hypothetical protein IJV76_06575, partial [Clostridia bacterium]|nr:hypothetical protein [Clostridia bacterium]